MGTRDGANLTVEGYDFAPSFSIWTTIEECLNPPVIWEADAAGYVTEPFSEPEVFDFPDGIGPVECVNVEHEEVLLMPRWVECKRATFKYGLGSGVHRRAQDAAQAGPGPHRKVKVGGVEVSPRDVVAACLPNPATLGTKHARQDLRGSMGDGYRQGRQSASTYLYHVVDNQWSMDEYGHQCVVWQTAINPVVAWSCWPTAPGAERSPRPRGIRLGAVPGAADGLRLPLGTEGTHTLTASASVCARHAASRH